MGLVSFSSNAVNVVPGAHHINTLMPDDLDGIYHPHAGLYDPSLQYAVLKATLNSNGAFRQMEPWDHDATNGVETSAVSLEPMAQYGPMSVVPAFNNYEAAMTEFRPGPVPLDQRPSLSPSQSSSATGSLSMSATMDLSSRRSSSAYPPHSIVSNSIERAQSDPHPSLISAAAAAAAAAAASTTVVEATPVAASPQEVEAFVGKKRSQAMTAAQGRARKTRTRSADTPKTTEYPMPSANPMPIKKASSTTDGPPFSTLASHSELELSQLAQVSQGTGSQRQRNRRAATKCREKTKAAMIKLEATEKAVTLEHIELSKTVTELRGQVLALKNELLLHGNCNCDVIQKYLKNAARSIGEGSPNNYKAGRSRDAAWTGSSQYSRHNSYS